MSTGKPWKLYEAREGHPRQLIAGYETLSEAAWAYRDVTGSKSDALRFIVTVTLARKVGAPTARFESDARGTSYLIEFEE